MEMCLRVLKESNKSRFDSYSRQEQCIDYIPFTFRDWRVHIFSDIYLSVFLNSLKRKYVSNCKFSIAVIDYLIKTL